MKGNEQKKKKRERAGKGNEKREIKKERGKEWRNAMPQKNRERSRKERKK